ncbi:flavonoid 3 -monooxygenase-like [Olea europaea subsp. europaea]|uniref:Flavonoid 3 -monooxygenase-like n=1 Tax=Olea europaea subsp. europaea TaxID=158383 RepID=A0A8S0TF37_OLEEU|nr:flavonoid 3 -monooxygenase-like [Olea europaea subsp. europaea]
MVDLLLELADDPNLEVKLPNDGVKGFTQSIGRDGVVWDEPEKFHPEKFLGLEMDVKGQNSELLPFRSGRRMCLGYSLGLKMVR